MRMTVELSHKKVWLRARQLFNLNFDRKLNKVFGIESSLSIDWWLRENVVKKWNFFSLTIINYSFLLSYLETMMSPSLV